MTLSIRILRLLERGGPAATAVIKASISDRSGNVISVKLGQLLQAKEIAWTGAYQMRAWHITDRGRLVLSGGVRKPGPRVANDIGFGAGLPRVRSVFDLGSVL